MSRQKSARSKLDRRALIARLLRHGERFQNPAADTLKAAAELQALSLIRLRHGEAVFCANPNDRDFPPRDPDCVGLIELRKGVDEGGGDYACPACDRLVHPILRAKERVQVLRAELDQQGIERFLLQQLGPAAAELVFERGTLVLPGRPQNRFICLVDFCTDSMSLERAWIETQPCTYITVDPRFRLHLGSTHHVRMVELVDLVCGSIALDEVWGQTSPVPHATSASPAPSTDRGARLVSHLDERSANRASGRFAVGLTDKGVVVNGMVIECSTSAYPYMSFAELIEQAASDIGSRREITPLTANKIAERIKAKLPSATIDPGNVQKGLKRLDRTILEHLKRAGFSIGEGDVIENVSRAGNRGRRGFRLNSNKVSLVARASS